MIRYATFGRRLWALVLDLIVDLFVLLVMRVFIDGGDVLAPFALWYVIHHVALVTEGGPLGHRLAGLRIVREDGGRLGVPHAMAREAARLGLSLPPLGMGFLWMLDHPERRCWHDLVSGSIVVRELPALATDAPVWAEDPPWRRERSEPDPQPLQAPGSHQPV